MAAGDNSTVKITINVVDANSGQVISSTTKNLGALEVAGRRAGEGVAAGAKKASAEIKGVGEAGAAMAQKVSHGMGDVGSHTLTSLDSVRLFRDEFGIHIPRSMEVVMSRSKAVMSVLAAMQSAFVFAGAVGVVSALGTQIYDVGKKIFSADEEVKKFNHDLAETARKKFMDVSSIEDVRDALKAANEQLAFADKKLSGMPKTIAGTFAQKGTDEAGVATSALGPIGGLVTAYRTYKAWNERKRWDEKHNEGQEAADAGLLSSEDKRHRLVMMNLDAEEKKYTAALREGPARSALERQYAGRRALENSGHQQNVAQLTRDIANRDLPGDRQLALDPGAGKEEFRAEIGAANADQVAKDIQFERQKSDEIKRLQQQANEAGKKGYAEVEAQRMAAREEFVRKYGASQAALEAIDRKYFTEEMERQMTLTREVEKRERESRTAGLTGIALTETRGRNRTADIEAGLASGTYAAYGSAAEQRNAANRDSASAQRETQAEVEKQMQDFSDRLVMMDQGRADASMSANDRIAAETKRAVMEIQKAWDDLYGKLTADDPRRVQGQLALNSEIENIQQGGARQQAQVHRELQDQTEKMEAEGARRGLTREQEQQRAILDEYSERMRHIGELRAKDAANADLYRRQEIAAEQIKNGQLVELQRQMRDRLAGTLRGFMNNPLEEMKRLGEDAASKYAANMLMRAGLPGINGVGDGPGKFGLPAGVFGRGKKQDGQHEHTAALSTSVSAASTTMSATMATIHVGQATFTGMPGGTGAALPAAAALQAAGGTGGGSFDPGRAGVLAGLPGASANGVPGAFGGWSGTSGAAGASGGAIDKAQSIVGMGQSTMDLGQQLYKNFKPQDVEEAGTSGAQGNKGFLGMSSSTLGKVGGAATGAMGLFSAYQSNGGFSGALGGAMSGMQLGAIVGGPIGAGIGAAAGAIFGFMGFGGASKAEAYYNKEVKPRIANDIGQYGMGQMDYSAAYDDLVKLDKEARQQTKQWGMGGKREWDGHIHPDIIAAQKMLDREQKAGRSKYGMSGAQFDGGGVVKGFGDFATGPRNGWINAELGETVVHTSATQMHGDALSLMLAGANREQMANYYGGGSQNTLQAAPSSQNVELHFHSPDARGARELLMDSRHTIREALNQSYAENSGGSDLG